MMRCFFLWLSTALLAIVIFLLPLSVAPKMAVALDLAKQPAIEVSVSLGDRADDLKFFPENLAFEAGKRYKLTLRNPSSSKHYFTAKNFADSIWSQKVDAGNVEIKGAIHELELKPGAQADWVFVPIKTGTYDLECAIAGHAEAGMVGKLIVTSASY
jgi:uncharacterized cupredoxin-like copper-binding protein